MTCYFPPQDVVEDRLLVMLQCYGCPVPMAVLYRMLANRFDLTRHERRGAQGDPKGSPWEYLVRQARKTLVNRAWVVSPEPGLWALTDAGREEARRRQESGASIPADGAMASSELQDVRAKW